MTATPPRPMSPPRPEPAPPAVARPDARRRRRLGVVALFALAPKCLLCAVAYTGLGAWLGLGGPELCGAPPTAPGLSTATPFTVLGGLGVVAGLAAVLRPCPVTPGPGGSRPRRRNRPLTRPQTPA